MSVASRKTVREEIGAILTTRLVPTYAESVHIDRPFDFGGESPIVLVTSAGSGRKPLTFQGTQPVFYLTIVTMALADADVDDILDTLEQQIAQFCEAYRTGSSWQALNYDTRSETRYVISVIDGKEYKTEEIPLVITGKL